MKTFLKVSATAGRALLLTLPATAGATPITLTSLISNTNLTKTVTIKPIVNTKIVTVLNTINVKDTKPKIAAVPEPTTLLLLGAGLLSLAWIGRKKLSGKAV